MIRRILYILILTSLYLPGIYSQQTIIDDHEEHEMALSPAAMGMEKPADMLQRKCTDCHINDQNIELYLSVINDTIKSKDKMKHSWLKCSTSDSSKIIHILAEGINSYNDTLPICGSRLIVNIERCFGRKTVYFESWITDEAGMANLEFPEGIIGDSAGTLKMNISLLDRVNYPNAKTRIIRKWGIPAKIPESDLQTQKSSLFTFLSLIFLTGMLFLSGVLLYIVYLLRRLKGIQKE